ncbi:probable protein disulfide-isomerase ER-60 isoform X1 [Hydra vulgaris]|uniref:Probable protein disulfide-isomerase ER-60 isoform X1 n=1 Tax=Hydra vulgaris TaxID=6087 RepID=A0ABM4DDY7_HYDVU
MAAVRVVILSFMFGWALAVMELNDNNFFDYAKRKEVLLVDFYTPWCKESKRLAPEMQWAALELGVQKSKNLAQVDCEGAGKGLCQMYQIRSWPQLKNFHYGTYTGDYTGPQSAEAIASYINTVEQSSSNFVPGYYPNVGYAMAPKDSLVEPAPPVVGALSCARCNIGKGTKCTKVVKKACVELQLREKAKKEEAKQNDDDKKRSVLVKKADNKKKTNN